MSDKPKKSRSGSFSKSPKTEKKNSSSEPRGDTTKAEKDRNYFLKYVQSVWHVQAAELPALNSNEPLKDDDKILRLKEEAKTLYETLSDSYENGTLFHAA